MKIVLTGATGFVGSEVLSRLIPHSQVTEITCLTRRNVPFDSPKVKTILYSDFTTYNADIVEHLADHTACIWALGGKASDLGTPEVFARITHTFTLALAQTLAASAKEHFTFCYLSGMGADPAEKSWFPWEKLTRHLKGRTEKDLQELQQEHPHFCAHSFRPGGILSQNSNQGLQFALAPIVVGVETLSDALITAAIDPVLFRRWPTIGNRDIKRLAHGKLTTS